MSDANIFRTLTVSTELEILEHRHGRVQDLLRDEQLSEQLRESLQEMLDEIDVRVYELRVGESWPEIVRRAA